MFAAFGHLIFVIVNVLTDFPLTQENLAYQVKSYTPADYLFIRPHERWHKNTRCGQRFSSR